MTVTLADLQTEVLQRLGDSAGAIWSGDEIDDYITEGYDDLTLRTGCLWEVNCFPDYAFAFNFTAEFEREFAEGTSGWYADGPAQFTAEWERDYLNNANGPANHTEHWEFNLLYQTITEVSALVDLPEELHEIERSTWNTKKITAVRSQELEPRDSRYERNKGNVEAYTQDKDGLRRLRKWRVPSSAYTVFEFDSSSDDGFGIIRFCGDIATDLVIVSGDYGDLVQVDEVNVFEDFGILGCVYREANSVRMEYRRRGEVLSSTQPFEIQDRYTVYVRHYAMSMALDREGDGHEPALAQHYMERYLAGIERMAKRRGALQSAKTSILGGHAGSVMGKPPLARLPWQYPPVGRR